MKLTVYLAGEIHSNWREDLKKQAEEKKISFKLRFTTNRT